MLKFLGHRVVKTEDEMAMMPPMLDTEIDLPTMLPVRKAAQKLAPKPIQATPEADLQEYTNLASELGLDVPNLEIERFKAFLQAKDIPVFNLKEVVAYMDEKAAKESKDKAGWQWHPLRAKDNRSMWFGTSSVHNGFHGGRAVITPASDYYSGPSNHAAWTDAQFGNQSFGMGQGFHNSQQLAQYNQMLAMAQMNSIRPAAQPVYKHTVPMHALKKVALIEREYKGDVAFFVCDYAPAPQYNPDPFLMAVVPNPNVSDGIGRFIIDFWDEPGFGIERMIK